MSAALPLPFRIVSAFALATTLLLAGCGGEKPAGCDEGVTACQTDAECGADVCSNGCCTASPPCESDTDCRPGTFCIAGFCGQPPDLTCDSDRDCANAGDRKKCDLTNRACVACLNNTHCSANGSRICTPEKTCADKPGGCVTSSDCAGRTDFKRVCDSVLRECVECASASDCLGTNVCVDNTCVPPNGQCTRDDQCAAPTPRCERTSARCVACLETTDCGAGRRCNANTCIDAGACTDDDGCEGGERCKTSTGQCVDCLFASDCPDATYECTATNTCVVRGCANDAECAARNAQLPVCLETTGACVRCERNDQCPANNTCTNNACVPTTPTGCTGDADCASNPSARKCDTTTGACVACLAGADCPSGRCGTNGACLPGCAADANCAAPTPKCNTTTNACVACLGNGDCTGGNICTANQCVPGCTSDAGCSGATPRCNTTTSTCVQCTSNTHCTGGATCQQGQCIAPQSGGTDQPCAAGNTCTSADDVCWPEGTSNVCRKVCNPYAATTNCGATTACEWIFFEEADPIGVCLARNDRGAAGSACTSADDCETGLLCTPTSASTGRCTKVCDPAAAGACSADEECRRVPALYDPDQASLVTPRPAGDVLDIGLCILRANNWGKRCSSDYSGVGATVTPDCGPGLTCGPNYGVIDDSIRVSTCQFPYGTGEADEACTSGSACVTGDCLDGPDRCNTSCRWTSDCGRAGLGSTYRCLRYMWRDESFWTEEENTTFTGACLQSCLSDAGCDADEHCMLSTTFQNGPGIQSSFHTYCYPDLGTAGGPQRSAGQPCTTDGQCASGYCVTNGLAGARDGYCFGACNPASSAASTQCDPVNGVVCDPAGVGFTLNYGADGIAGNADDAIGKANVCVGARCVDDADCMLDSFDPAKPRSCQLILQANVANSAFPGNNTEPLTLRSVCAPSVGTLDAGDDCTADSQCLSGWCYDFGAEQLCLGVCDDDFDCAGFSLCEAVDFGLGSASVCVPWDF